MAVSEKRRLQNLAKQRTFKMKKRMAKALKGKVAEDIINDVQVLVSRAENGNLIITFDMSPETEAVLELYCQNKGFTLDDYQQDLIAEVMAKHGAQGELVTSCKSSS